MERYTLVFAIIVAICAISAIDASTVGEKLRTRIRAPPLVGSSAGSIANSVQSMSAVPPIGSSSGSSVVPIGSSAGAISGSAGAPSESGAVESIAATKLVGQGDGCENSCSGNPIQWGSSSSSSSSNSDSNADLPSVDDVVGPIASWIKAFKKRVGGSGDLATTAKALVAPLIEKLKRNQHHAQEKLEQSNEAILDSVERSVTEHVLKLLKAEKITEAQEEASEVKKEKQEAVRDEQSEKEYRNLESSAMESLSSQISKSLSELSKSKQSS